MKMLVLEMPVSASDIMPDTVSAADLILANDIGKLADTGGRVEVFKNAKGYRYWQYRWGSGHNRRAKYGGTFQTIPGGTERQAQYWQRVNGRGQTRHHSADDSGAETGRGFLDGGQSPDQERGDTGIGRRAILSGMPVFAPVRAND